MCIIDISCIKKIQVGWTEPTEPCSMSASKTNKFYIIRYSNLIHLWKISSDPRGGHWDHSLQHERRAARGWWGFLWHESGWGWRMQIVVCQSLGLDMVQNNVALNGSKGKSAVIFCFWSAILKLCTNYAVYVYNANIMQMLRRYYAEIMQKLCRNYVYIMQNMQILYRKLRKYYAEIMQKSCRNYAENM